MMITGKQTAETLLNEFALVITADHFRNPKEFYQNKKTLTGE